jgi:hypothetical protein
MRKLIAFHRSLATFLFDPAGHIVSAWDTIKAAVDPKTLAAPGPLRDAVVVIDNMVEAVTWYVRAESKEPEQIKLGEGGEG